VRAAAAKEGDHMTSERRGEISGTWMRGADGGLYFIPDADLETYRVPDELAGPVLAEIDEGDDTEGLGGLEATGQVDISSFVAVVRGPLGIKDIAAAPAIIPPPPMLRGLRQPQ